MHICKRIQMQAQKWNAQNKTLLPPPQHPPEPPPWFATAVYGSGPSNQSGTEVSIFLALISHVIVFVELFRNPSYQGASLCRNHASFLHCCVLMAWYPIVSHLPHWYCTGLIQLAILDSHIWFPLSPLPFFFIQVVLSLMLIASLFFPSHLHFSSFKDPMQLMG